MSANLIISEIENNISNPDVSFEKRGGRWDENGLVSSLDRKGFTPNKCCAELMSNSIDKQATRIIWKINSECIKLIDDGIGMSCKNLEDMFAMFKANNEHKKSMGVSGLGGKEGMYILSKKINKEPTTVTVFTQSSNGEHIKAVVPWGEIIAQKIYTGKIIFTKMIPEEIEIFTSDRKDCEFNHGTTIQFEYNDELKELIETQFDIKKINSLKLIQNDRWGFIFGHFNTTISLDKSDGTAFVNLIKYDYFSGNELNFYNGRKIDTIEHYVDDKNEDRYIYLSDKGPMEILAHGKSAYKNEPTMGIRIHQSWKKEGYYEIKNGMRTHKNIFDPSEPSMLATAKLYLNSYDLQHFPDMDVEYIKNCLSGCPVYRNNQLITSISFDDKTFNSKTSRAGAESMINKFYHRTEIHYSTYSRQDNRMDIVMGIQENKNQNQNVLPKPFERLVTYIKSAHLEQINNYFGNVIKEKKLQDEKKRQLEIEKKRLEIQQKKIEEEKKRIEQQESRRLDLFVIEEESETDDSSCNETEIVRDDILETNIINSEPSDIIERLPITNIQPDALEPTDSSIINLSAGSTVCQSENLNEKLNEIKIKILETVNSVNDLQKIEQIYNFINNI